MSIMRAAQLLLTIIACPVFAASWDTGKPLPHPIAGHAALIDRESVVWVAGGSVWRGEEIKIVAAIWRLGEGGYWQDVGSIVGGYAHGAAVAVDGAWWLIGGLEGSGPSRAIRRIDLPEIRSVVVGHLPEPRVDCGAAELAREIWLIGGTARDGDFAGASTAVFRIDPARGAVSAAAVAGPAVINPLVLAFGDDLHVLPGSVWSPEHQRLEAPASVWIYSRTRERWDTRLIGINLPRGLIGVRLDERRAWVGGGVESGANGTKILAASWIYDSRASSFTPAPAMPAPRLAAAALFDRGHVYVLGGEDRPRGRADTVWRISAESLR
jgi:hypothetical protein